MALKTFIAFSFYLILGACFSALATEVPPDLQSILSRGTLRVAVYSDDIPPYLMRNSSGELFGFDISLLEDISKRLGVKLQIDQSSKTYNELIEKVSQKKVDLTLSVNANLERAKKVSFTDPYRFNKRGIWLNRLASQKFFRMDLLKRLNRPDIKVAILQGSTYSNMTKKEFPQAKHQLYPSSKSIFDAIVKGDVVFAISSKYLAKNYAYHHPGASIKMKSIIQKQWETSIHLATHWQNQNFLNWLNLYVKTIQTDGTLGQLKKKFIQSDQWRKK